jgi:predicted dehydrogenase
MIDREQPDFVDVITPPETHEEMCAYAAARGVHIICQKPLAPSLDGARRIVATARAAGVRFMVHENWRWQPWYREIKRIQSAGTAGPFTHIHFLMRMGDGWRDNAYLDRQPFFRGYPRLLVYETGVHFIDTFPVSARRSVGGLRTSKATQSGDRGRRDRTGVLPVRERGNRHLGCKPLQRSGVFLASVHVRSDAGRCDGWAHHVGH